MFIENTKVRTIQERLCNKIYAEAKSFEDKGKVKATKKDLFLEQSKQNQHFSFIFIFIAWK